ncbi:uncharacterized protein LOC143460109 isoform X2 [Clavelina lepadiformis]|uniref:uncharacterized protein LOC143460109 isoform X2 n=1 Tax=Clavelina lepadiformis TaxID=159417 RepID=UPI0040424B8F
MPVRNANFRRRGNDEYSFTTRPGSSRDFARHRRYGDDEDDDHVMSQVSSPLHLSKLGKSNRRNYSPLETYSPPVLGRRERDESPYLQRKEKLSGPVRHALALCGELDEEDPYYLARRSMTSTRDVGEDYFDGHDDEVVMTPRDRKATSQRRYYEEDEEPIVMQQSHRYVTSQSRRWDDEDESIVPTRINTSRMRRDVDEEDAYPEIRQRSRASTDLMFENDKLPGRVQRSRKRDYSDDTNKSYTMPVSRRRPDDALAEEEPAIREVASYIATRKKFAIEDDDDLRQLKNKKYQYRTRGPTRQSVEINRDPIDRSRDRFARAPMFDMKLRSHVIWEKMYVKFTCTIKGTPEPKITWYHNMVAIEPMLKEPGVVRISNQFGVHTLEIFKACLEDSGTYRVSAQNHKGEISSYATLLVRRYDDGKVGYYDIKSGYNMKKPTDYPDVENLNVAGYPRFVTRLFNKKVNEGDAVILTCHVDGKPAPEVFWTLNGRNLDDKINHIQTDFDGKVASLTILRAYADDEGEYVCRAYNSCGASTSRCFLSVHGVNAPPSAPTGVQFSDATRNFVVLSWKPPGYLGHFGGAPIQGYLIEKAEAGSSVWRPANKKLVRLTKTPIMGLEESQVYFFRVRAFNRWGRSPASMPVGPVAMRDPGTPRLPLELVDPETLIPPETDDIFIEEEDPDNVPGVPTEISAQPSSSGDCVFVKWSAPENDEIDGYLIEFCDGDNENWQCVTSEPLHTTDPYPVTGLSNGKSYKFRVRAVNGAGESEPSETTEKITVQDMLEQAQQLPVEKDNQAAFQQMMKQDLSEGDIKHRGPPTPPRDVSCLNAKREYIEIGWTPPAKSGGEQVRYFIENRKLGTDVWLSASNSPVRYTQYPIGELEEGEKYMFRVRAVNKFGTSTFSEPSEPILASDGMQPPNWWGGVQGIFRVADDKGKPCVTKNSIKLCWEPPSTDGGSRVTGYYLEYRPCGGKFRPVNNKPLSQRHFTIDNLNSGEKYEFRLRACNEVGCGDWKIMPGRIQAKDPERPGEPKDLTIISMLDDVVDLTWKKPSTMGDGEFVGYLVERRKEDADFWIPCNKLPEQVQDEKYIVSGLVFGQTYFFRVTAVNQIGKGIPSLQSCFVTIGEPFDDVLDRQNAIREIAKKKLEEEQERLRLLEEEARRDAFSSKIKDCYVAEGSQGRFVCHVKDRRTKVTWYLGNWKEVTLAPTGKYDIISIGNKRGLLINNCCQDDVQVVHCVAEYNNCTTTADLTIGGMAPVRFLRFPTDVHIKSGETAVFDCVLSKPNAEVAWTKNDYSITTNDNARYEFVTQGCGRSLIIKDATQDDIAMYRISGLGGSYLVNLVVDGLLPVKFEKKLEDFDLPYTADIVDFECQADPSPLFEGRIPSCKWYHNGELVEPGDDRYELVSFENKHTLKILKPTYEDNGTIKCVVAGGNTACSINIEKPPPPPPVMKIKAEDYIINFKQGLRAEALPNALRLFCIAETLKDDAHIIWYINDTEVKAEGGKYKCFNDSESGLVSLVISPIKAELVKAKFTCEFITPLSTFDTKVNFEFEDDEFQKMLKKSAELFEEEEEERKLRREEREKKKHERKTEEGEKKEKSSTTSEQADKKQETPVPVPEGLQYEVTQDGAIVFSSEAKTSVDHRDIVWLKDSEPVDRDRCKVTVESKRANLIIKEPCADDAGTYTCQIQANETKYETSADITGKVFKQLLLKSAEIRIKPLADCDAMINADEDVTQMVTQIVQNVDTKITEDEKAQDKSYEEN